MATITPMGFTYPDETGEPWADSYEANLQIINDAMGSGYLRKVSDDSWGEVETGVEYYAPDQHGNFFGTVYRQYFDGTSGTGTTGGTNTKTVLLSDASSLDGLINFSGAFYDGSDQVVTIPHHNNVINGPQINSSGELVILHDSYRNNETFYVWIDYTKTA